MKKFPPHLQVFQSNDSKKFASLDAVGEFSSEAFLVMNELIFIQEKTNYPGGSLTRSLYEAFGFEDRFSVIARASWRAGG